VGIQLWRTQMARWANDKFGGSRSSARSGQLADVQSWLTLRMVGRRQGRRMALARGQHHGGAAGEMGVKLGYIYVRRARRGK
jgi:hypothetical protein